MPSRVSTVTLVGLSCVVLAVFMWAYFAFTVSEYRDESWADLYEQVECTAPPPRPPHEDTGDAYEAPFWNTQEYQTKLSWDLWEFDRREEMIRLMSYLDHATPLEFDRSSTVIYIRSQFNIKGGACDPYVDETEELPIAPTMTLRVRNYYCGTGDRHFSYTDAKYTPVLSYWRYGDVEPHVAIPGNSPKAFYKREQDIHPCHYQWSRSARVYDVPFEPTFETCADVRALYPNVCDHDPECLSGLVSEPHPISWWWVMEVKGTMFGRFPIKSAITIPYLNLEDAMAGVNVDRLHDAEWSVRVYVSHDDDWELSEWVKEKTTEWYHKMVLAFEMMDTECPL